MVSKISLNNKNISRYKEKIIKKLEFEIKRIQNFKEIQELFEKIDFYEEKLNNILSDKKGFEILIVAKKDEDKILYNFFEKDDGYIKYFWEKNLSGELENFKGEAKIENLNYVWDVKIIGGGKHDKNKC